jgi:DNA-binding response OmpR family regulator
MIQERPKEPADDILIVDDVPENLNLLERILIGAGYRVRTATGGDIALRSVGVKAPALVLLDVRMPDPDGYEVCRRLKADARTAGIPVIFISALEDESQKVRGFHMGAVDYIGKPFHSEEVLARVNTHLSLRRARMDLERRVRERTEELAAAIAKLEAEVAERKRDEEKIRKALAEKDILLRELYHRTNNNMQIICSIFNLRLREIPDEGTQRILMDMINRINSMAIVHDLLYKSKDLSRIDLREYIVDLTGFL